MTAGCRSPDHQQIEYAVLLGGVDEFEPVSCGSNMNHADEALGELVVSSSNGAVDFQSAKHPFD